jgi:hypothetical protein
MEEASMHRHRRKRKLQRRRLATTVAVFGAVFAFVVGTPTLAAADPVNDVLNGLGLGSGNVSESAGGGSATPDAGTPPTYTPPLHGTNPHGQGTDAVIDLTPSNSNPYPGTPSGRDEEVIAGDSRGEQTSDGSYHGSVALAYLFGNGILGVETNPGESKDGPLQPLQEGLNQLCDASNRQLCASLLEEHSSTTGNSSTNSFEALGAHVGGEGGINADVATSHGNIADDGTCQTAHGDSSVADASVGGALFADALQGSSTSTACNNGSQSVDQNSTVLGLGSTDQSGLPLPTAGCENGTPNTNFTALAPLLATVCNADDTNGSQTGAPYGVRDALTLFVLMTGDTSVLKVTGAGPESHAVAPPSSAGPTTPNTPGGGTKGAGGKGGSNAGNGGSGGGANGAGRGNGSAAGAAAAGNGQLAFTGADLVALGMVGTALILGGLALTTTAGRRHRQTV